MKKIEAIIPEDKVTPVFQALTQLELGGFTYHSVKEGVQGRDRWSEQAVVDDWNPNTI